MLYIIDRIEGDRAVLETASGGRLLVVLSRLPADVREGSCLTEKYGYFYADTETELARRSSLYARQQKLKTQNPPEKDG